MQREVNATNEILLTEIIFLRFIIQIVCLSDKLLVLLEEIVNLEGAHESRSIAVVLDFSAAKVLSHAAFVHDVELDEAVGLGFSIHARNVRKSEVDEDDLLELGASITANASSDSLESSAVYIAGTSSSCRVHLRSHTFFTFTPAAIGCLGARLE